MTILEEKPLVSRGLVCLEQILEVISYKVITDLNLRITVAELTAVGKQVSGASFRQPCFVLIIEDPSQTIVIRVFLFSSTSFLCIFPIITLAVMTNPTVLFSHRQKPRLTNIYVNFLPAEFTDSDLLQLFQPFGDIDSYRVMGFPDAKNSFKYGFVRFTNPETAKDAICAMNHTILRGQQLLVKYSNTVRDRETFPPSQTLYIRHLPADLTHDAFRELLEPYGSVECIRLMAESKQAYPPMQKGYVRYSTTEESSKAIEWLDRSILTPDCPPLGVAFAKRPLFDTAEEAAAAEHSNRFTPPQPHQPSLTNIMNPKNIEQIPSFHPKNHIQHPTHLFEHSATPTETTVPKVIEFIPSTKKVNPPSYTSSPYQQYSVQLTQPTTFTFPPQVPPGYPATLFPGPNSGPHSSGSYNTSSSPYQSMSAITIPPPIPHSEPSPEPIVLHPILFYDFPELVVQSSARDPLNPAHSSQPAERTTDPIPRLRRQEGKTLSKKMSSESTKAASGNSPMSAISPFSSHDETLQSMLGGGDSSSVSLEILSEMGVVNNSGISASEPSKVQSHTRHDPTFNPPSKLDMFDFGSLGNQDSSDEYGIFTNYADGSMQTQSSFSRTRPRSSLVDNDDFSSENLPLMKDFISSSLAPEVKEGSDFTAFSENDGELFADSNETKLPTFYSSEDGNISQRSSSISHQPGILVETTLSSTTNPFLFDQVSNRLRSFSLNDTTPATSPHSLHQDSSTRRPDTLPRRLKKPDSMINVHQPIMLDGAHTDPNMYHSSPIHSDTDPLAQNPESQLTPQANNSQKQGSHLSSFQLKLSSILDSSDIPFQPIDPPTSPEHAQSQKRRRQTVNASKLTEKEHEHTDKVMSSFLDEGYADTQVVAVSHNVEQLTERRWTDFAISPFPPHHNDITSSLRHGETDIQIKESFTYGGRIPDHPFGIQ
ncbi:hypothetical protein BLNAU_13354 [Blattamonas nauphoetae]|uniref:RRM domain-containing protein n=1 Tax=Blattamonas nauphoetae TaxID=2049346 RepID=A0ABQ9XH07_9EUKA|nr:hypothetical protein BLNAU_13354 [Blattamonas nauphoetae]